jgi:hypothetical protein
VSCNTHVTHSPSPANARTESELKANPLNALNTPATTSNGRPGDRNPGSPYYGHVYAAWDEGSSLAFARAIDQGATWRGVGTQAVGSHLASDSFASTIAVMASGTVFIVWIAISTSKNVVSTDSGDSFSAPQVAVSGSRRLVAPAGPRRPGRRRRTHQCGGPPIRASGRTCA